MSADTRAETLQALRDLADYLETHPQVPLPYIGKLNAFGVGGDLPTIARAMGGFEKGSGGGYLELIKRFGSITLAVNFNSDEVCERVVVGTERVSEQIIPAHEQEIVEWRCPESLLQWEAS